MILDIIAHISLNPQIWLPIIGPFTFFYCDFRLKKSFNISLDTLGGDLCVSALGIDISQLLSIMISDFSNQQSSLTIFLPFLLVHVISWVISISLVANVCKSNNNSFYQVKYVSRADKLKILLSYFLGSFSFILSINGLFMLDK